MDHDPLVARLRRVGRTDLRAMYDAAAAVTECVAALAENGKNPVTEVLNGADLVEEWAHFPPDDAIDRNTHSQFYYHAHVADERVSGEHGHFHTFVRPDSLGLRLQPASIADTGRLDDGAAMVTHIIGISTDASGQPLRLFTTNRWVTGEAWYGAETVIRMLDRFEMNIPYPSQTLNRWVTMVVRMYRPQIEDLIHARDARLRQFKAARPAADVFEDRALHVLSEVPVNFLAQIRAIEAALPAAR